MRVAVVDRCPAYRHGLSIALEEAGFVVEESEDLRLWAPGEDDRHALVAEVASDDDARRMAALREESNGLAPVALLTEGSPRAYAVALAHGLCGAVARSAALQEIVEAVRAGLAGRVLLPVPVATALAAGAPRFEASRFSPREIDWIRALAGGQTVSRMAESAGYSERAMHRHLKEVYGRLGAGNRTEALIRTVQAGLLDDGFERRDGHRPAVGDRRGGGPPEADNGRRLVDTPARGSQFDVSVG